MNRHMLANLLREIKKTITRFLSIFAICALGVSFFAGIRATSPNMKDAGDALFEKYNLADISVISTSGLTGSDIRALRQIDGVEAVRCELFVDAMMKNGVGDKDKNIRLLSMPIEEKGEYVPLVELIPSYDIDTSPDYEMNILEVESGRLPLDDSEIALDVSVVQSLSIELGNYVTFSTSGGEVSLRVVGSVNSPKYIGKFERGSSTIGNGSSDGFGYISGNALVKLGSKLPIFGMLTTLYTQADIVISGKEGLSAYSEEYENAVNAVISRIEDYAAAKDGTFYIFGRSVNPGYTDYSENTERIAAVGDVFPLIFFVVAALVSLTTMTRMVEEQRIEMGTLKAIGYGSFSIISKYLLYAMSACLLGGIFGAVVGFKLFPSVICGAYSIMYRIPELTTPFRDDIALLAILAAAACTGIATLSAAWAALSEVPATLMRPKAPKAGKRVLLEYVGFIWKKLNFTAKVTIRNLFRYKKRFFMSVIGIAGSCALLVTGFGLKDSIFGIIDIQFGKIWLMDMQAYAYDTMPLDDIRDLIENNDAAYAMSSILYDYDNICEAGNDDDKVGGVHLLGVESVEAMKGKINLHDGNKQLTLTDDGAIITRKLAEIYSLSAGDTISIYSGNDRKEIYITGIADNYVQHYVYITPAYYEKLYGKQMQYNAFMMNLIDDVSEEEVDKLTEDILSDKRMYTVKTLSSLCDDIMESLSILDYVVLVLIGGSALLTFVVMLNLTNINLGERKRELATLRVLGFYDKEMYDYIFRENNALAVIGSAAGLALGKIMHSFIIRTCEVDLVMFVRSAGVLSYIYSFVLTIMFSLIVNLLMRRKVRAINMVESLKSAE